MCKVELVIFKKVTMKNKRRNRNGRFEGKRNTLTFNKVVIFLGIAFCIILASQVSFPDLDHKTVSHAANSDVSGYILNENGGVDTSIVSNYTVPRIELSSVIFASVELEPVVLPIKATYTGKIALVQSTLNNSGLSSLEIATLLDIQTKENLNCHYDYGIENPYATGCFQILPSTWGFAGCTGDMLNPIDNTNCAIRVYKVQGFRAWAVYN